MHNFAENLSFFIIFFYELYNWVVGRIQKNEKVRFAHVLKNFSIVYTTNHVYVYIVR